MSSLLDGEPVVVSAGVALFADALRQQAVAVTAVDWRPPLGAGLVEDALARVARRPAPRPTRTPPPPGGCSRPARGWSTSGPRREALGLEPGTFLHAGRRSTGTAPPGPCGRPAGGDGLRGPGERPRRRRREARRRRAGSRSSRATTAGRSGRWPESSHRRCGSSSSRTRCTGGRAWCSLNEGLGKVLRYGAYGPEVIERLRWMTVVLGPLLAHAVRSLRDASGGRREGDPRPDAADGRRGPQPQPRRHADAPARAAARDDRLRRTRRRTSPAPWRSSPATTTSSSTSACRPASSRTDAARDVPGSTVVVAMARNGTDFGIQVSGTGDRWFTGPANTPEGLFLGASGPTTPTPTSATRRSPRRPGSAASRWRPRRRSSASSAATSRSRSPRPGGCTRSPWPRTRRSRIPVLDSGGPRPAST